ncbi:Ig-like domain-containing protein [Lysinibacillus sp. JNUCC 51]|uniref:Ig-like domain-containing protein n=1 Tax=Lysinibacillus sp. JNUCC-51 TaxID=2792479 RepID=UPI0019375CC8|nr:Ig domain-containing protein [Lysinibacillus sp. JNUCC-51]
MSKLLKKGFIYLAFILVALVSISIENASAAEVVDYEEGVTNLNNTLENSAKRSDVLKKPEIGWKRYDDSLTSIQYLGSGWSITDSSTYYKGKRHASSSSKKDDTIKFVFSGTKIRLIAQFYPGYSNDIRILIDGNEESFSLVAPSNGPVIVYEKTGLSEGIHDVEIKKNAKGSWENDLYLDAIDVDGKLLAPDEIPNVETISLDRNVLELLEGSQDKLIATVTPDTAKVIWSSSDESIATVDQDGNVTALHEGEAIITAKIENTDIAATSTVIVKKSSNEASNAILSITLVNGITKEYDVTNKVLNDYLKWFDSAQGTSTFKFTKTISPYKKVTEYIVHDKIASFEVREY